MTPLGFWGVTNAIQMFGGKYIPKLLTCGVTHAMYIQHSCDVRGVMATEFGPDHEL